MAQAERKDTYLATAITLMVIGGLFLLDKFFHFASHGYGWLVDKSNLLLFAAVIFQHWVDYQSAWTTLRLSVALGPAVDRGHLIIYV